VATFSRRSLRKSVDRYRADNAISVLVGVASCGFEIETERANQGVEVIDDALVEAIKLGPLVILEAGICADGAEKTGCERRVDALEELEEYHGDRVTLRQQSIAAGAGEPGDKTFGTKFGEIVTEGGESIAFRGTCEGLDDEGMDFRGGKGAAGGNVGKAYEGVHHGQLARVGVSSVPDMRRSWQNVAMRRLTLATA
jgi:hypothetical protein